MTFQSTQELIPQDKFSFHGNGHAAIFEVKFDKKTERTTTESRERSAEQLFDTLEPVAFALEGSDLGTAEVPFEPTARGINDTNNRQLTTRSGLPRLTCCVRHLHHKWAMKSPAAVRKFSKQYFKKVCHFKVDVVAGDANAAAYKCYINQEYPDLCDSSVAVMLRETQREVKRGHTFESKLHTDYSNNNHPPQLHAADDLDCGFMDILSW